MRRLRHELGGGRGIGYRRCSLVPAAVEANRVGLRRTFDLDRWEHALGEPHVSSASRSPLNLRRR
jgi:hypothetical protein